MSFQITSPYAGDPLFAKQNGITGRWVQDDGDVKYIEFNWNRPLKRKRDVWSQAYKTIKIVREKPRWAAMFYYYWRYQVNAVNHIGADLSMLMRVALGNPSVTDIDDVERWVELHKYDPDFSAQDIVLELNQYNFEDELAVHLN